MIEAILLGSLLANAILWLEWRDEKAAHKATSDQLIQRQIRDFTDPVQVDNPAFRSWVDQAWDTLSTEGWKVSKKP